MNKLNTGYSGETVAAIASGVLDCEAEMQEPEIEPYEVDASYLASSLLKISRILVSWVETNQQYLEDMRLDELQELGFAYQMGNYGDYGDPVFGSELWEYLDFPEITTDWWKDYDEDKYKMEVTKL